MFRLLMPLSSGCNNRIQRGENKESDDQIQEARAWVRDVRDHHRPQKVYTTKVGKIQNDNLRRFMMLISFPFLIMIMYTVNTWNTIRYVSTWLFKNPVDLFLSIIKRWNEPRRHQG